MEYMDRAVKEFENIGNQLASQCSSLEALKECWKKIDLLLENAVEIGQTAHFLEHEDKIIVEDGKELSMFCVELAKQFEEQFDSETGDYYVEIDEFASEKLIDKFGKPTKPEPVHDLIAYQNSMYCVCYVPENAESEDDCYTHSRLLALVQGDEALCDQLFDTLSWQFPETLIDENIRDGLWDECKACGRLYDTLDDEVNECPHCHTKFPKNEKEG